MQQFLLIQFSLHTLVANKMAKDKAAFLGPLTAASGMNYTQPKDSLFLKDGDIFHKVLVQDILYLESDNIYLSIYTAKKKYVVRRKLDDFIAEYAVNIFLRIHRSYAINLNHLETINSLSVNVGGMEVPLQKPYKQKLLKALQLLK